MFLFDIVVSTLSERIENFTNLTKDLVDGTLGAFIKSQAVPDENDGPVKVAVAKNFKQVVMESGRDAFVKFYSPTCRHCQKLEPVWEQLGDKMREEAVDIVKIDATANDWPKSVYEITGVPTMYWKFADSNKKPVRYTGKRDLDDFVKYIAKQVSVELNGWDRNGKPKEQKQ